MICTFFGHADAPLEMEGQTKKTITYLIENKNVDLFFVGNNGNFDYMVRKVLRETKKEFPNIKYNVVLAYMPKKQGEFIKEDFSDTLLPEALEKTPKKFAIYKRNEWMLKKSDIVVVYVKYIVGGASTFYEKAIRKGKEVYNLSSNNFILK